MSIRSILERSRAWGWDQVASLTPGQRWTSALALGLAVVMLVAGMPSNVRVVAAPPPIVVAPPPTVGSAPPPVHPIVPPATFIPPASPVPPPHEPPAGDGGGSPPTPIDVNRCLAAAPLNFFTYPEPVAAVGAGPTATAVEQLEVAQATYEEATGQPLGVDLASVVAFAAGCSDALPSADALVAVAEALAQIYDALEAAGVPPIDLPDPPVVSLPEVPEPLQPVLAALAPATLFTCGGISTALALTPVAGALLPFPSSEILPYLWPVRALCGLLTAYAPPPEGAASAELSGPLR